LTPSKARGDRPQSTKRDSSATETAVAGLRNVRWLQVVQRAGSCAVERQAAPQLRQNGYGGAPSWCVTSKVLKTWMGS
jgi:hypothetical protein